MPPKVVPLLAAVGFACALLCVVVAIPTEFWTTSFDGTGSHSGLWRRCWTVPVSGAGAVLQCEYLDWNNLQASFRSHGAFNEPPDEAAAKWGVMLATRACMLCALSAYALATTLQGVAAAGRGNEKLLFVATCALAGVGGALNIAAIGCYAYLSGKWSQVGQLRRREVPCRRGLWNMRSSRRQRRITVCGGESAEGGSGTFTNPASSDTHSASEGRDPRKPLCCHSPTSRSTA